MLADVYAVLADPLLRQVVAERFWAKVSIAGPDECWLWTGAVRGGRRSGYGSFAMGRKQVLAHRFAYMLEYGPIPRDVDVCHRCDVRLCVNPAHLWTGTNADNVMDCVQKGRSWQGRQKRGRTPRHCGTCTCGRES
jgi:hypothetical protein